MSTDLPDSAGDVPQDDIDAALAAAGGATEGTPTPAGDPAPVSNEPATDAAHPATQDTSESETPANKMEAAVAEESEVAEAVEIAEAGEETEVVETAVEAPPQPPPIPSGAVPMNFQDFAVGASSPCDKQNISLLNDVQLDVKIELGRANMLIEDVLKLGSGSVVELDKLAGDPVDVLVNDRLVARGEVLVLNDNFCVRISEILVGPQLAEASA